MLKGRTTYSPTFTLLTPEPTSTTSPMFSCPRLRPCSKDVRPSYMFRSEAQMFVEVIRTMMSLGCSIRASGTSLTLTSCGPLYTTAFMSSHASRPLGHGPETPSPAAGRG
ncbi:hypothetical protein ASD97_39540 [Streptomyces sp. Root63]|nr:hypothetical protein ASD29_00555 [Streptomyces sp. Root1295]KRA45424.1 hypothetical protein ASD97_39540 [Streptomyces sp. Root63]